MKSRRYTSIPPFFNPSARRAPARKTRAANDNRRDYVTLGIETAGLSIAFSMSRGEMRRMATSFDADLRRVPSDADLISLTCSTIVCVLRRFGANTVETHEHCRRAAAWMGVNVPLHPGLGPDEIEGCTYLIEEVGDGKDARVELTALAILRASAADGGHRAG